MSVTSADPVRLVLATLASAAAGAVVYLLVIRLGLPVLVAHLTDAQVGRLRDAFRTHPGLVAAGVLGVAAILALPVPLIFRVVYGPLRGQTTGRADA